MRDAAKKANIPIGSTPLLLDAARRYENRDCAIFKECILPHCEGGVWCDIYNLGGSHGQIGFAYRHLGKSAHDVPLKKRRKLMLEMLEYETRARFPAIWGWFSPHPKPVTELQCARLEKDNFFQ